MRSSRTPFFIPRRGIKKKMPKSCFSRFFFIPPEGMKNVQRHYSAHTPPLFEAFGIPTDLQRRWTWSASKGRFGAVRVHFGSIREQNDWNRRPDWWFVFAIFRYDLVRCVLERDDCFMWAKLAKEGSPQFYFKDFVNYWIKFRYLRRSPAFLRPTILHPFWKG